MVVSESGSPAPSRSGGQWFSKESPLFGLLSFFRAGRPSVAFYFGLIIDSGHLGAYLAFIQFVFDFGFWVLLRTRPSFHFIVTFSAFLSGIPFCF